MIRQLIPQRPVCCARQAAAASRRLSSTPAWRNEPLPSSPEMKESWDIAKGGKNVTSRVIGLTKALQRDMQPPLSIDNRFTKRFTLGDSYDPFDLSSDAVDIQARVNRDKRRRANSTDPFERSGINPLDLYTMPAILSRFLTTTGQILPREVTGCSASNQKKLAKAIERARVSGLLSSVHKDIRFLPTRNM